MNRKLLIKGLMTLVLLLGLGSSAFAQFMVKENFRGQETSGKSPIIFAGVPRAFMTATDAVTRDASAQDNTTQDTEGEGWTRLNPARSYTNGAFYVDEAFSSAKGVFVDFQYTTWSPTHYNADGISFFLYNGAVEIKDFKLGGGGGALGYGALGAQPGLFGGYLGLGIDEYGNFTTGDLGRHGTVGRREHNISMRGKTYVGKPANESTLLLGYKQVTDGLADYGATSIDADTYNDPAKGTVDKVYHIRPTEEEFYRRVQIEVNQVVNEIGKQVYRVEVRWAVRKGGQFYKLFSFDYDEAPYETLKMGFSGSSGDAINAHEVRDLFATTPGGVMVEKLVNKTTAEVGTDLIYTINLKSQDKNTLTFKMSDNFDGINSFFEVVSIEWIEYNSGASTKFVAGTKNMKDVEVTLPGYGTGTFKVKGKIVTRPKDGNLVNTATINRQSLVDAGVKFIDENKITSTVTTIIPSEGDCGCPEGAAVIADDNKKDIVVKTGDKVCISSEVHVKDFTVETDGEVYVTGDGKLIVTGKYTENGGFVSICPFGGIEVQKDAVIGSTGKSSTLSVKTNGYFSVCGNLTVNDPGDDKQVEIQLADNSFFEVKGTYKQNVSKYGPVSYVGKGLKYGYFITKGNASGKDAKSQLSDTKSTRTETKLIAWLYYNNPTNLTEGTALKCTNPFACTDVWPKGLDKNNASKCNEVENFIDRTDPVGPEFCENEGDKFISVFHSTLIKTAKGFEAFGERVQANGSATVSEYPLSPIEISFANGFTYKGSPMMATSGSHYRDNNQNFLLTTKGLYVWGSTGFGSGNQYYSVVDRNLVKTSNFQKMELPAKVTPDMVRNMTATHKGLLLLLKDGRVMVSGVLTTLYGDGSSTQDGKWHTVSTSGGIPLANVEMVRVHTNGGFAYTKDGKYYMWGNTIYNGKDKINNSNYSYATEITKPAGLVGKAVMLGVTGDADEQKKYVSYYILGENGKVYSIGDNKNGQLGNGTIVEAKTWQVVQKEEKAADGKVVSEDLTDIQYLSAQDHSSYVSAAGAIDMSGKVYLWGANEYNMQGQDEDSSDNVLRAMQPLSLEKGTKIVYVEVGGHTTMIVNDKNKYCYVGHKINGSMGDGKTEDKKVPTFDCLNTAEVDNMCGKLPIADMTVEKRGTYIDENKDGKVNVGDKIQYNFTVTNTGGVTLKDIKITDAKITTVEGGPITLNRGGTDSSTFKGEYVLTQKDIDRGGVFNQAIGNVDGGKIKIPSYDPNPKKPTDEGYPSEDPQYKDCKDCTVTILKQDPKIELIKTAEVLEDSTTENGEIKYSLKVTNTGNVTLNAVDLTDSKLSGKLTLTPEQKTLVPGGTWTVTATYVVTEAEADAGEVINQADVKGKSPRNTEVTAKSGTSTGNTDKTVTPIEGGGPLITNPHIYHKVQ